MSIAGLLEAPPGSGLYTLEAHTLADFDGGVPIGSGDWRLHVERIAGNVEGAEWDVDVWDSDAGTPGFVTLPGVAGNYLSVPDAAELDITGDLAIVARIAPDDWTPSAVQAIVAKYDTTGNQRSYLFDLQTSGALRFGWSNDGTASPTSTSTSDLSALAAGAWKWVAVSFDVDNGAAGNDVRFWTSDDGATWTQLGATVTTAGATSIFNSTAALEIGSRTAGASTPFDGKIDNVQVFAHIGSTTLGPRPQDMPGGTPLRFQLYDADFTASPFTTASGHTATLNTSGGTPATITAAADIDVTEWAELGWEPMVDFVRGVDWFRGAQAPQGRPDVAEIGLTLGRHPFDADRFSEACDPWVNYQNTRPGTVMRAALTSETDTRAGGWLPLWAGLVESWTPRYFGARQSGYQADVEVDVRLVDTLSWLAQIDDNALGSAVGSGEGFVARIERLLSAAEWPFGLVELFGGDEPATALQSTDMSANRLTELYLTADSVISPFFDDTGIVMSDATGACLVRTRNPFVPSRLAEFSSAFSGLLPTFELRAVDSFGSTTWHLAYDPDSLEIANDPEPVINDHRYARVGGTQQVVEHAPSIGVFGRKTRARGDLICTTDADVADIARADNDREARTAFRVEAVDVAATGRPNVLLAIAAADFGDTALIVPPNGTINGTASGPIRALYHQITPMKGRVHWTARFAVDVGSVTGLPGVLLPVAS